MTPELICVSKTTATFRLNGEVQQVELMPLHSTGRLFCWVDSKMYFLPDEFQPRKKS